MKTSSSNDSNTYDWVKWSALAALAIFVLLVNQKYSSLSEPIRLLIGIGWFVLSSTIFYFTKAGKEALSFFNESKSELQKVVWPTRQETIQTTVIIMVMVFIVSLLLWVVDSSLLWAVGKITNLK